MIPGVNTPDKTFLGPSGDAFPDEDSLPVNVTVDTPDALPRDPRTGDALFPDSPGAYVNGDGIFFDGSGTPINRDTGEALPAGTTVDAEGYLQVPVDNVAASSTAAAPAAAAAAAGGAFRRIGPDGNAMPEDVALPVDQLVTPDRRPRSVIDLKGIGERGA
jgi:hypothetical protein